jgi:NADPH:quinone reductase-like Zn-dependent oxidoreductase
MEYVERGGKILIPRIQLQVQLSSRIERGEAEPLPRLLPFCQPRRSLKLKIGTLGDLKSLCFIEDVQVTSLLDCLDIEVKVVAAGVKMLDVKTMLGQTSYDTIGTDVSGIITRVGSSVSKFKVGDRVVTLVLGAYKSLVRVTESMCQLIPDNLSFEIAASLPSNLASAYYSLITIGRLEKDEFVLIHDAASAFGQMAIQIVQAMGANIFATFRTQEERNLLIKSYCIDSSYLFAAGSSQLVRKVDQVTNGQGIDIVLNTLPRDNLEHTWKVINPCKYSCERGDDT